MDKGDLVTDDGLPIDDGGFPSAPLPPRTGKGRAPVGPISDEDAFYTGPPPDKPEQAKKAEATKTPTGKTRTSPGASPAWDAAEKAATTSGNAGSRQNGRSSNVTEIQKDAVSDNPYLAQVDTSSPARLVSSLRGCAAAASRDAATYDAQAITLRREAAFMEGTNSAELQAQAAVLRSQAAALAVDAETRRLQAAGFNEQASDVAASMAQTKVSAAG